MIALYLALIALAGFATFSLCSNLIYWYERLNAQDEPFSQPRPGLLTCARMYAISLCGYLTCVLLLPFGPLSRHTPGLAAHGSRLDGDPALPPIILIHGLNNNASAWLYLGRVLRRAGWNVSTYDYRSLCVPVDAILRGLDEHVRQVEAASGGRPLLIGHSLGGILARTWLQRPEYAERIAGLITLGTPHGGSKLAALAPGALAEQIMPRGALITALRDAAYPGPPCVALVSPTDEAVLPSSGLVPPQGWRLRMTTPVGHYGMLYCPSVARMVLEEVRNMTSENRTGA